MVRVAIAGGGTGGHIFPGLAIAEAIKKRHPDCEVVFIGSRFGLEARIWAARKLKYHLIWMGRWHSSAGFKERVKTFVCLPIAFFQAVYFYVSVRPHVVLGVGGYASVPFVFVASRMGCPCVIWEPNAYPGLANRWLSGRVDKSLVVFQGARKFLRSSHFIEVGMPVRQGMRPTLREKFADRKDAKLRVFVTGGSQGARALNQVISELVTAGLVSAGANSPWRNRLELVHQTGVHDFDRINRIYLDNKLEGIRALSFVEDMQAQLGWADFVISRSGASIIAELCACHKAVLFVPYPHAADQHQRHNAEALVCVGAAQMILQPEFSPDSLGRVLEDIFSHPEKIDKYEKAIAQFDISNSADKIADEILEMIPRTK